MENQTDHDLLIALNTKMEMLLSGQQHFIQQWGKLLERTTALEIEQGRLTTELKNLQEEIDDMQKKVNIADAINAAIAAVAGAIGFYFGGH